MKSPFSVDQFFSVFENYNTQIFPAQILVIVLGFISLGLIHSKITVKGKLIGAYLGVLWLWIGVVYHIVFFTEINKAALLFGGLFILQSILMLVKTFSTNGFEISFSSKKLDIIAYFFILFGLIIYPIISYALEGSLVKIIAIGLPCPSTIFTFGVFILCRKNLPKYLLIIPTLWSLIGLSAAINFGVYQDFMLIISAITTILIVSIFKNS